MLYLKIEQCFLGDSALCGLPPGFIPPVLPGLSPPHCVCCSLFWHFIQPWCILRPHRFLHILPHEHLFIICISLSVVSIESVLVGISSSLHLSISWEYSLLLLLLAVIGVHVKPARRNKKNKQKYTILLYIPTNIV